MQVEDIVNRVMARFIGTKHERDVKKIQPAVGQINALEAEARTLSEEQMRERIAQYRQQVTERLKDADPAEKEYKAQLDAALGEALPGTFALVREAGRRLLNMRHFDVQLIGGIVLHEGKI